MSRIASGTVGALGSKAQPRTRTWPGAGEETDGLYVMLSGRAKVLIPDDEGHEVILAVLGQRRGDRVDGGVEIRAVVHPHQAAGEPPRGQREQRRSRLDLHLGQLLAGGGEIDQPYSVEQKTTDGGRTETEKLVAGGGRRDDSSVPVENQAGLLGLVYRTGPARHSGENGHVPL